MPLLPSQRFRIRRKSAPPDSGTETTRRLRRKTTPLAEAVGESSSDEGETAAQVKERGRCGQFVWPCPRRYPADIATRRKQKWLVPADLDKQELGGVFQNVCFSLDQGSNLKKLHVFDEPHKKFDKISGVRARHKHVVFKMGEAFAHVRIQRELAKRGIHGHFSFNLLGYRSYLRYCLMPSAKKLLPDLDRNPWSWPSVPAASLLSLCEEPEPHLDARGEKSKGRGRKRKLLTFSEMTDAFIEGQVKTEKQAWQLAKARKVAGDDTLYNTLGDAKSVATLVCKVWRA